MKIFLDANILFSAAFPGSRVGKLLELALRKEVCLTSEHAYQEAFRNLMRKMPERSNCLQQLRSRIGIVPTVAQMEFPELRDRDIPILASAIASECTHLLTGDERDFGKFFGKTIHDVKIVKPSWLAQELGVEKIA